MSCKSQAQTNTCFVSVLCVVHASKTIQHLFFFPRVMLTHVKCINIPIGMTHLEGIVKSLKDETEGVGEAFYNCSRY